MFKVELAREVNPRLGLVRGGGLLGEALEYAALRFTSGRQGTRVGTLGPVEQPRDHAVFAFVDRCRRCLTAHRAVYGFNGGLARERRGVGLPRRDLAPA